MQAQKAKNTPLPKVRPYTIIIFSQHASTSHFRIKSDNNKNMQIWDNSEMTQAMRAVEVHVPEHQAGRLLGRFATEESVLWESACAEAGLHSETAIWSFTDRMLSPDTDSAFFFKNTITCTSRGDRNYYLFRVNNLLLYPFNSGLQKQTKPSSKTTLPAWSGFIICSYNYIFSIG